MVIYLGADHEGFRLKEDIRAFLQGKGYEVADMGNRDEVPDDDYPDFAAAVAEKVSRDPQNGRGILVCGSGVGMDIAANKFANVRSALVANPEQAYSSRNDDDANVLSLSAHSLDPERAKKIISVWLQTPFSGEERHRRRIEKIEKIEHEQATRRSGDQFSRL